jgi:Protein of unknown function (DUF1449)
MAEVFVLALSFPSVVYTVLLGVALVYWAFVMVGVVHIGEGSEGALDGHVDHLTHGHGGPADGDLGLDLDADDSGGALAAIMSALHLRSVPATVVFSFIITFSWLVSVVSMQLLTRAGATSVGAAVSLGVLFGSLLLSLPLTSLAARPLAKVFAPKPAPVNADFVGRTCVVRTGTVTAKFGEATLHDGGAGLVLRVRVGDGKQLGRGEQALIVDYDAEHETYLVEPMRDVMTESGK